MENLLLCLIGTSGNEYVVEHLNDINRNLAKLDDGLKESPTVMIGDYNKTTQ